MLRRAFLAGVAGSAMASAATKPGRARPVYSPQTLITGFGQLTAVGAGGIPTSATAIVAGNTNGDFQITRATWTNFLGDTVTTHVITKAKASLSQPSYTLHTDDGSTVTIRAESHVWDVLTQEDWWDVNNPDHGQRAAKNVLAGQTVKFRPGITLQANISAISPTRNPFYAKNFGAPGPTIRSRDPANPCNFAGNWHLMTDYTTWEYLVSPDVKSGMTDRITVDGGDPAYRNDSLHIKGCEFYTTPVPIPGNYSKGWGSGPNQWPNGCGVHYGNGPHCGSLVVENCVWQYFGVPIKWAPTTDTVISGNLIGPYFIVAGFFPQASSGGISTDGPLKITDNVVFGGCCPGGAGPHQDLFMLFAVMVTNSAAPTTNWGQAGSGIQIHRNIAFQGPATQDYYSPAVNQTTGAIGLQGPIAARGFEGTLAGAVAGEASGTTLKITSGAIPPLPAHGAYYLTWNGMRAGKAGPSIVSQIDDAHYQLSAPTTLAPETAIRIVRDSGYYFTLSLIGNLMCGNFGTPMFDLEHNNGSVIKYNTVLGLGKPTNSSPSRQNFTASIYGGTAKAGPGVRGSVRTNNNVCELYTGSSDLGLGSSQNDYAIGLNGSTYGDYRSVFAGLAGAGTGSGHDYNPWNPSWAAWNGTTGLYGRALTFAMPAVIENVRNMFKVRPGGPLDTGGPFKVGACDGAVTWATGVAPSDAASNGRNNV